MFLFKTLSKLKKAQILGKKKAAWWGNQRRLGGGMDYLYIKQA